MHDIAAKAVRALMLQHASPYTEIRWGSLPLDNGLATELASGTIVDTFLDQTSIYETSMVLNGKHSDRGIVLGALSAIHTALSQDTEYPIEIPVDDTQGLEIIGIQTSGVPSYLKREESTKQWVYGSSLRVSYILRRECN